MLFVYYIVKLLGLGAKRTIMFSVHEMKNLYDVSFTHLQHTYVGQKK